MKFVFLIISVWALFWDRFYFISQGLHVAMWHFLEISKIIAVSLEAVSEWLYPAILLLSGLTESLIALIDFPENVVQKPSLFSVLWWIPVIELVHSVKARRVKPRSCVQWWLLTALHCCCGDSLFRDLDQVLDSGNAVFLCDFGRPGKQQSRNRISYKGSVPYLGLFFNTRLVQIRKTVVHWIRAL